MNEVNAILSCLAILAILVGMLIPNPVFFFGGLGLMIVSILYSLADKED